VTWLIRLEDKSADGKTVEKQITFPASHSFTEEEVTDTKSDLKNIHQPSNPTLDEGEKS
jgi:hypothetical protein